jgi:hypothetical protein
VDTDRYIISKKSPLVKGFERNNPGNGEIMSLIAKGYLRYSRYEDILLHSGISADSVYERFRRDFL